MKSKGIISMTLKGETQLGKGHRVSLLLVIFPLVSFVVSTQIFYLCLYHICGTNYIKNFYTHTHRYTHIYTHIHIHTHIEGYIWNISDRRFFVSQWTMSHENILLHGYEGIELPWIMTKKEPDWKKSWFLAPTLTYSSYEILGKSPNGLGFLQKWMIIFLKVMVGIKE